MSERIVVLCTVGRVDEAERIAEEVVGRRLAACASIVPAIVSIYRWQGKVERDEERLLILKTRAEQFEALREAIVALHPYEVPEVIALPLSAGHAPYLSWLDESVG